MMRHQYAREFQADAHSAINEKPKPLECDCAKRTYPGVVDIQGTVAGLHFAWTGLPCEVRFEAQVAQCYLTSP